MKAACTPEFVVTLEVVGLDYRTWRMLAMGATAHALATTICASGAASAHRRRDVARGTVLFQATRRHIWLRRRWTS